jgi:hypothetical protein
MFVYMSPPRGDCVLLYVEGVEFFNRFGMESSPSAPSGGRPHEQHGVGGSV